MDDTRDKSYVNVTSPILELDNSCSSPSSHSTYNEHVDNLTLICDTLKKNCQPGSSTNRKLLKMACKCIDGLIKIEQVTEPNWSFQGDLRSSGSTSRRSSASNEGFSLPDVPVKRPNAVPTRADSIWQQCKKNMVTRKASQTQLNNSLSQTKVDKLSQTTVAAEPQFLVKETLKALKTDDDLNEYLLELLNLSLNSSTDQIGTAQKIVGLTKEYCSANKGSPTEMIRKNVLLPWSTIREKDCNKNQKEALFTECKLQVYLRLELHCLQCLEQERGPIFDEICEILNGVTVAIPGTIGRFLSDCLVVNYKDTIPNVLVNLYDHVGIPVPPLLAELFPDVDEPPTPAAFTWSSAINTPQSVEVLPSQKRPSRPVKRYSSYCETKCRQIQVSKSSSKPSSSKIKPGVKTTCKTPRKTPKKCAKTKSEIHQKCNKTPKGHHVLKTRHVRETPDSKKLRRSLPASSNLPVVMESPDKASRDGSFDISCQSNTSSPLHSSAKSFDKRKSFYSCGPEARSRNVKKFEQLENRMTQRVLSPNWKNTDMFPIRVGGLTKISPRRIKPKKLFDGLMSPSPKKKGFSFGSMLPSPVRPYQLPAHFTSEAPALNTRLKMATYEQAGHAAESEQQQVHTIEAAQMICEQDVNDVSSFGLGQFSPQKYLPLLQSPLLDGVTTRSHRAHLENITTPQKLGANPVIPHMDSPRQTRSQRLTPLKVSENDSRPLGNAVHFEVGTSPTAKWMTPKKSFQSTVVAPKRKLHMEVPLNMNDFSDNASFNSPRKMLKAARKRTPNKSNSFHTAVRLMCDSHRVKNKEGHRSVRRLSMGLDVDDSPLKTSQVPSFSQVLPHALILADDIRNQSQHIGSTRRSLFAQSKSYAFYSPEKTPDHIESRLTRSTLRSLNFEHTPSSANVANVKKDLSKQFGERIPSKRKSFCEPDTDSLKRACFHQSETN